MRIELRDENRMRLGRAFADETQRPTRVNVQEQRRRSWRSRPQPAFASPREAFLNWDTALDDAGQLRRCVACGCNDMFREKAFPQVTGLVVMLAFIGAVIGALGLAENLPVLIVMCIVLVLDVAILVFSKRRLVCYRCRSSYHELPIARYHRPWDRAIADRYPAPAPAATSAPASPLVQPTLVK